MRNNDDGSPGTSASEDEESAARSAAAVERIRARKGAATVTIGDLIEAESSVRGALDTIGSTWAMLTLTSLNSGNKRYSQIKRSVPAISDRMLSQTLRGFVRDGLATRTVLRTIPSHVEYELTDVGRQVCASLSDLLYTIMRLAPDVAQARACFEATEAGQAGQSGQRGRSAH
ncbi:helix-turn-helix domain-containing protein [Streptomyces sp. NPDC052052]|uniref:winged helix-turn-helix transcriptional regulator n=1 Tax=Streptomyces sp. NPDC052052 TaxID=3154756 RepID=UPI0034369828